MNQFKSILAGAAVLTVASVSAADARSYVSGNFMLDLNGVKSGFLNSVEGGAISGEVVTENLQGQTKKHIGQVKYEEFSMAAGFSMDKSLLNWVSDTFDGLAERRDGAITAVDYQLRAKSKRSFQEALITEVTIPACDGSSKEPAYMTLKIAPEFIKNEKGDNSKVSGGIDAKKQKQWLSSNFRLNIPGVNCSGVKKIDAITVKQTAIDEPGDARDFLKEPGKIEFPNLRLTVAALHAQDFINWHEDFVIGGNNSEDREKTGTLSFLSTDQKEELAKLTFYNLGIFRVENSTGGSTKDGVTTVVIDLYVERMEIDFMAQFEK